jgi:hypothetical protein
MRNKFTGHPPRAEYLKLVLLILSNKYGDIFFLQKGETFRLSIRDAGRRNMWSKS